MIALATFTLGLASFVSVGFAAPATSPLKPARFIASASPSSAAPRIFAEGDEAPISYKLGRPVLTGDVSMYYIYYGNFSSTQKSILEDFAKSVGSSPWYSVTRQYYYQASEDAPKQYVEGSVKLGGTVDDNYSRGRSVSNTDIPDIIQELIDAKKLPEDDKGVYFFLNSADVSESIRDDVLPGYSFCNDYCGYHLSWKLTSGTRIFYAQVGVATACLSCAPRANVRVSPNNDPGLDSMISTMAHELTETVTDPGAEVGSLRAWDDANGSENADKCQTFGITNVTETGARYNYEFGGRKWMIRQNWSPVEQKCISFV